MKSFSQRFGELTNFNVVIIFN